MPIAARFHELRDRIVKTVDDKFAEPVRLSPMKNGAVDTSRPQIQIDAGLRTGADKQAGMQGGGRSWKSRIAAGQAELRIDRTTYPDVRLAKGDSVRALARHGEPVFEVLFVDDRDHTRLIVGLGQK